MVDGPTLRTERLLLRRWTDADRDAFAAINADPVVMEHFPPESMTRASSDQFIDRLESSFQEHGFGLWAMDDAEGFVGFVGLLRPSFEAHFTPAVEIGWRLARDRWGRGYATEGARAAMGYGFDEVGLDEIVSFTISSNTRSWAVMERLGMTRDPADDFDHPRFPVGHPFSRHLLYRMPVERWRSMPR